MAYPNDPEINAKRTGRLIGLGVLAVIIIVIMVKSSVTVNAGEGGVLFETFGAGVRTDKTYDEGFHIIMPWNNLIKYNIRQQEVSEGMAVLSSNGLEISVDVSAWLQPLKSQLPLLHQEKGQDYIQRIVKPAIRSATRSVIGRYTPEEIYSSKRDDIQYEIQEETKKILDQQYIQLNNVLVRDITLPPTIKTAIETKLKHEQASLEYEFRLKREQKEAERVRIEAEGKAEANRILNASLTTNILKEKGIAATVRLAESKNSKVIVVGGSDGLPLILGNN